LLGFKEVNRLNQDSYFLYLAINWPL